MRIDFVAFNPSKQGSKESIQLELVTKTGAVVHIEWTRSDDTEWANAIATVRGGLDRSGFIDSAKIAAWLARYAEKKKFDINDPDALVVNLERRGGEQLIRVDGSLVSVKEVQGEVQRYRINDVKDVDGNDITVRASNDAEAKDTASKYLLNLQNDGKIDLDSFVEFLKNKQVEKLAPTGVNIPTVVAYAKRGGKRAVAAPLEKKEKEEVAADKSADAPRTPDKKIVVKKK